MPKPGRPNRWPRVLARMLLIGAMLASSAASAAEWAAAVFMYHRFGEDRFPSTSVPLERFEQQLDWLVEAGIEVWSLSRLMRAWRDGREVPQPVVAITVDDAYASVYSEAWPRLRARGMPFTVFVATAAVDGEFKDMMSWEQMREMRAAGVEFANHSVSHDYLQRRRDGESAEHWRQRITGEIQQAQRRLQAELGEDSNRDPALFAYPYGEYSVALMDLVEELGYLAFGQHSGALGSTAIAQALPRYPINTSYGELPDFRLKARSLSLPVLSQTPLDPVLAEGNPPGLILTLGESGADLDRITCYASGQGRIPLEPVPGETGVYRVEAPEPLGKGRSRYNCTAPQRGGDRWYWFSQLWIR